MTMSLFERSSRIICVVLLLSVAAMASFGSVFRYGDPDAPELTGAVQYGANLATAHPQCQHSSEHFHDILPALQGDLSSGTCASAAYAALPDTPRHETGISLVDPPPRA